ncbi:acyl-CoA dehydrogenase family protein [Streptomyces sp. NPDC047108]|uniref:acyl-CoA dehydrogenase family protein n=1 Tax=Streptomyces sp. NPDC047108 TaxID=3155025 RepID=UPI0033DD6666
MDFRLTEDQEALRRGFRELLARRFPRERLRAAVDHAAPGGTGVDRALWRDLGEAGLFALRLPEEGEGADSACGGVGLGLPEAVLLFEEAGRALLPGPLVATHLAVTHLARTGRGAGARVDAGAGVGVIEAAARGEAVVTALDGRGAGDGNAGLVEHLPSADAVLVVGDDGDGRGEGGPGAGVDAGVDVDPDVDVKPDVDVRIVAVGEFGAGGRGVPDEQGGGEGEEDGEDGEDGAEAVGLRSVDPATPLHRVALAPWRTVSDGRGGGDSGATGGSSRCGAVVRREAALLTAAQQLGSASCTVAAAVRYAGEREQFGQPIGAFQAVKHLCARMLVRAEVARSAVYAAAVTGDAYDIAAAKLLADDAAVRNARDCLQVHGGMGFTWEADVHLHLKRAWVRSRQWRSAAEAEELLADNLVDRRMSRQKAPSAECPNDSAQFG